MGDLLYLGYADYLPKPDKPHTRINCIAKAVKGKWQRSDDFSKELPPIGKVFAVSLPWIETKQPVAIKAIPNPRIVIEEGKDRLIVDEATPPRQVMDFRQSGIESARTTLLEIGVVRVAPYSRELIAAISDTQCIVVTLSKHPTSNRLVASSGTVEVFGFEPAVFEGDQFDNQFLEVPEVTVREFQEETSWLLDQDLLDIALKRLKKFDEKGPSRGERERLITVLNRARELAQEDPDWNDLKVWLGGYISRVEGTLCPAEEIAAQLSDLTFVKDELDKLRTQEVKKLRSELEPIVREEIESDLSELYDKWEEVENQLEKKKKDLDESNAEYNDLLEKLGSLRDQLFQEIDELNDAFGQVENKEDPQITGVVARLREVLGSTGQRLRPIDKKVPPWAQIDRVSLSHPIQFDAFMERLCGDARKIGLDIEEFKLLDLALRSGALLVQPQRAAEIMIPAYAKAATGGEIARQPLGPGLLSLDDLWTDPVRGELTAFGLAWEAALQNRDRFYLVWLDGLQRTPMDTWLSSLIGVLASECRPDNLLVAASVEASVLDQERAWPDLEAHSVPLNPSSVDVRPGYLLSSANGAEPEHTSLSVEPVPEIDRDDFLDYLEEIRDSEPDMVSLEAGLYRAASRHLGESSSVSDRLRQTARSRHQGRAWLKELFEN